MVIAWCLHYWCSRRYLKLEENQKKTKGFKIGFLEVYVQQMYMYMQRQQKEALRLNS